MSKRAKRLAKLRQNPFNVKLDQLQQVLEDFGFGLQRVSGSHYIFQRILNEQIWTLAIPFRRPIKAIYVKQALQAIDEIQALLPATETAQDEEEDGDDEN